MHCAFEINYGLNIMHVHRTHDAANFIKKSLCFVPHSALCDGLRNDLKITSNKSWRVFVDRSWPQQVSSVCVFVCGTVCSAPSINATHLNWSQHSKLYERWAPSIEHIQFASNVRDYKFLKCTRISKRWVAHVLMRSITNTMHDLTFTYYILLYRHSHMWAVKCLPFIIRFDSRSKTISFCWCCILSCFFGLKNTELN